MASIIEDALRSDRGAVIMHDLSIPGVSANIDHVVVRGRTITLVDAKAWSDGIYFTLFGRTYRVKRGSRLPERFDFADKGTMVLAKKNVGGYLQNRGVKARFAESIVVVSPDRGGAPSIRWLRVPGARAVTASDIRKHPKRLFPNGRRQTADPAIVQHLTRLVRR